MVRTMARGLVQAGLEVHVAATDDNGHGRLRVPHGVPVIEDGVTYRYFRRQTRFYTFSWPLSRWLARHVRDYDLVHVHALFSFASVAAAHWAARAGVPYVVRPLGTLNRWGMEVRRPWLKRLSFSLIERRILRNAARIHYVSEQERAEATRLGVSGRATVVPLGVDLAPFDALPARGSVRERDPAWAGRTLALFLSRLDRKKGLDLLLAALAQARAREADVALTVAGNGDAAFERAVRRDAVRLGIETDIRWTGFLDGREKLAALADADLFVLPSYSENFGVAAVEAMAAGLPVVVSDQVGIHREVAEARAGLVVPCDPEALADAMLTLASDPALRAKLGARGRQLARDRFSLDAMTDGLVAMYGEAGGTPARSPRMDGRVASPTAERA
jgi:glycosyltransferase involved in cell wall biosynthesis